MGAIRTFKTAAALNDVTITSIASGEILKWNGTAWVNNTLTEADIAALSGATLTGVHDFGGATSLELPNGAAPTVNADGEIAVDTTVTDFSHGILKYYSGEEMAVVAMPIAQLTSPTDAYVVSYNATNDEFELVAGGGGGGGATLLETLTLSSDATKTSGVISNSYTRHLVIFRNVLGASDGFNFRMQFHDTSGLKSGASDYKYGWDHHLAYAIGGSSASSYVELIDLVGNAAGEEMFGAIEVHDLRTSGVKTWFQGFVGKYADWNSTTYDARNVSGLRASAEDNEKLEFKFSSGNLASGSIEIWGLH